MDGLAGRAITEAISRGVPLFNAGDAAGCLAIYKEVSSALVQQPQHLPAGGAQRLKEALDATSKGSAQDRAWTMRHALDDVIGLLAGDAGDGGKGGHYGGGAAKIDLMDVSLQWRSIDDRVMGGQSRSRMAIAPDGGGCFEGELVIAGGGFASVRSVIPLGSFAAARALLLRCCGDGRPGYKLTLKTDSAVDGVQYQLGFSPPTNSTAGYVRLPLSDFKANFRGQPVPNAPPIRGEQIVQVGLMLSRYDDTRVNEHVQAGPFRLRVYSLEAER